MAASEWSALVVKPVCGRQARYFRSHFFGASADTLLLASFRLNSSQALSQMCGGAFLATAGLVTPSCSESRGEGRARSGFLRNLAADWLRSSTYLAALRFGLTAAASVRATATAVPADTSEAISPPPEFIKAVPNGRLSLGQLISPVSKDLETLNNNLLTVRARVKTPSAKAIEALALKAIPR